MSDLAIKVENLSKQYKIGVLRNRHDSLRDHLSDWAKSLFVRNGHSAATGGPSSSVYGRSDTIWALKADMVVYHNHGRRTDSDWEITCRNYARGRGGFYCKHILTGDREILRLAYWEINDLWKKMWREVLVGNFAQKDLSALWNLLLGTIYRLREEIRR